MEIKIEYVGSWRNSFLKTSEGQDNKSGRDYKSAGGGKYYDKSYDRDITLSTVTGILSRLIGDQRKLYQAKDSDNYYFRNIEDKISFIDKQNNVSIETVFLRNKNGAVDKTRVCGLIDMSPPLITEHLNFWSLLFVEPDVLLSYIKDSNVVIPTLSTITVMDVVNRMGAISKFKNVEMSSIDEQYVILNSIYPDEFKDIVRKDGITTYMSAFYNCALYLHRDRLGLYDTIRSCPKKDNIKGFSKKSFTPREFIKSFSSCNRPKRVYGNPYRHLKKVDGTLIINIDVDRHRASEIKSMIQNANVTRFYVGKKGLAYISKIKI